jgi:CheY-like chemotaxis protein
MPEANGHEVIKQLKSDVNTSNIPFVFISASIQKKQINQCLEMGADAFVIKPFDVAELLNTLKTCLEKNRLP